MDGLEKQLAGRGQVIRLELLSAVGRAAAREYKMWLIPAAVLVNGDGTALERQHGTLNAARIMTRLQQENA